MPRAIKYQQNKHLLLNTLKGTQVGSLISKPVIPVIIKGNLDGIVGKSRIDGRGKGIQGIQHGNGIQQGILVIDDVGKAGSLIGNPGCRIRILVRQ